MIEYYEGTIFNTDAEALVNTVNCVGVMAAGLALEFGLRYPELLKDYENKCKNGQIEIGKIYYYDSGDKMIVNFPTKRHFKYPSQLQWIEFGLQDFVKTYKKYNFKSIAFSKLGTLNGHLDWKDVKPLMEKYLSNLDIKVYICLDTKKEAEGTEKKMVDIFNSLCERDFEDVIKLPSSKIKLLKNSMPLNRFWKIKEIDGIGITTYTKIHNYCYKKAVNNDIWKQMSLF